MGKRMPNQCILEETRYIPGVSYRWHSLFSALGSLANWGWIFQTSETDNVVQGTLEPPHKGKALNTLQMDPKGKLG